MRCRKDILTQKPNSAKTKKSYWKNIDIVLNAAYHVIKTSQTVSKETQPVRDNIDTAVLVMCKIDSSHRRFLCSTPQPVSKKGGYDTASVTCLHERVTCKLDFDQVHGTREVSTGQYQLRNLWILSLLTTQLPASASSCHHQVPWRHIPCSLKNKNKSLKFDLKYFTARCNMSALQSSPYPNMPNAHILLASTQHQSRVWRIYSNIRIYWS